MLLLKLAVNFLLCAGGSSQVDNLASLCSFCSYEILVLGVLSCMQ